MSKDDEVKKELDELKELLMAQIAKPNTLDVSAKYVNWIRGIIGLAAVIIAVGISWGVTTTKLTSMETSIIRIEATLDTNITRIESEAKTKNDEQDADIGTLQTASTKTAVLLEGMQKTLEEVRGDVKKILEKKRR